MSEKVVKKSGKPFKSGNKMNTIKSIIEHPKRVGAKAYTFIEDDSYVSVECCELVNESEGKENTDNVLKTFTYPNMFDFYVKRNTETGKLDIAFSEDNSSNDEGNRKYFIIENNNSQFTFRSTDAFLSPKRQVAKFDGANEKDLLEKIKLIYDINKE